ncbi:MAG: alcohol dehydrogenase catalytic domain-containing protein [Acidimicrobiales bacterium]
MKVEEVPDPHLLGDDWLVLKTRLTGICGSDTKQVLMDFEDAGDNPMTAFISFPQVLGHEVVADVVEVGPAIDDLAVGQRVVLNPWLSCGPRGISPVCPECEVGNYSACWHFCDGRLAPGIHTGNSADATGGFAEYLPAHRLMAVPVPEGMPDEVAVLADPFSVSLHAVTRTPPPPDGRVVVYGAGALGTTATAILRALHPDVEVATIALAGPGRAGRTPRGPGVRPRAP